MKRLLSLLLALSLLLTMSACASVGIISSEDGNTQIYVDDSQFILDQDQDPEPFPSPTDAPEETDPPTEPKPAIAEDGWYYSAEEVSLYLYTYGYLPENFITKNEARDLGWEGGSIESFAEGCAIGGDKFGNREGLLPKAEGRQYYECDIDTDGAKSRGAKRLVFSNDGLIYYTENHYESFDLLYGEELLK